MRILTAFFVLCLLPAVAWPHDTWVQTNTNLVRTNNGIYIDLMLGNHGNEHRDFKLASKITLDPCTLHVVEPDGSSVDLKSRIIDTGYAPKEGYWSAKYVPTKPGVHTVAHSLDTLHRTTRAIKSGKTFFIASPKLDEVAKNQPGFNQPLGHALELIPETNPVVPKGPQMPIKVQLLFKGKPLPDARVTFVPRGTTLKEGFDEQHERLTDAQGRASFKPKSGNYYLVVVHHMREDETGEGYDKTAYSATLTVLVPDASPFCD